MDFAGLAKVYSADGPFVSAYLDTHARVENGAAVRETAWKNAVRMLSESSVDDATIQMLTPLVLDETPAGGTRVIIASPSQIHIAKWMPTPPSGGDELGVGPLPPLLPLIEAQVTRLAPLLGTAVRGGGD